MSRDYAPCAHHALFLHYAETGLALGLAAGVALGACAILAARALRKTRDTP